MYCTIQYSIIQPAASSLCITRTRKRAACGVLYRVQTGCSLSSANVCYLLSESVGGICGARRAYIIGLWTPVSMCM